MTTGNIIKAPALSIWQPWAWLIAAGYKDIDNRNWRTNYQGPIYIHASKTKAGTVTISELIDYYRLSIDPAEIRLQYGGLIGRARLAGCVRRSESKWFEGPFGFVITDAELIDFIPCRGKPGIFEPDFSGLRLLTLSPMKEVSNG